MTAKADWLTALITKHGPELVDRVRAVLGMDVEPAVFKKAVAQEAKAARSAPAPSPAREKAAPEVASYAKRE